MSSVETPLEAARLLDTYGSDLLTSENEAHVFWGCGDDWSALR